MMKTILTLLLFCGCTAFCQTPAEVNKAIGLPDSLSFSNEIRVYKDPQLSPTTEMTRLYQTDKQEWMAEYYKYTVSTSIATGKPTGRFEKNELAAAKDISYIWAQILDTNIHYLPTQDAIEYKLYGPTEVKFDKGEYKFTKEHYYGLNDGVGYVFYVKAGSKTNHVEYFNPEDYLKVFPNVDEMVSVVALISIIRDNFNIWKE